MPAVSLTVPQRGALLGIFESTDEVVEPAKTADETGAFEALWLSDSILATPHFESITTLAALSTVTSRVKLAIGCLGSTAVRDPILLASQLATVDELSEGRVIVAVCPGVKKAKDASAREGAPYGVTDASRRARMEEAVVILRRLWAEDDVTFDGRYTSFAGVSLSPKPRQSTIPVYITSQPPTGAEGESALRRIARLGDGWMTTRKDATGLAENRIVLSGYLRDEGRDPETFPVVAYHNVNINPDEDAALEESGRYSQAYHGAMFGEAGLRAMTALGPVERVVEQLNQVFAEGATQLTLRLTTWDWRGQLRMLVDEVIPALRTQPT